MIGRRFVRFEALVKAASAVKICSRKKGKVNGSSKLETILLGYYIKTWTEKSGSHADISKQNGCDMVNR